ncbi:TPA: hypothetical protein L4S14_001095 [Pseudomonas aeruginosa]|nr:hypothetical protein [Pseudomonas aeruginosa]
MSTQRILDPEGELLNILECVSPLEWRRYQQRNPEVWINGHFERAERPEFPPYVSFRFKNENQVVIDRLKKALALYSGKIKWLLVEHKREFLSGTNWVICPSRMVEVREEAIQVGVSAGQYLAKYEPEFGPAAYDDLIDLTENIRRAFL